MFIGTGNNTNVVIKIRRKKKLTHNSMQRLNHKSTLASILLTSGYKLFDKKVLHTK